MKWELIEPREGDMIRVKSGSIYHYGVYVSDEEIIQFGLAPSARPEIKDSDIEVCVSDIDVFLQGGFLEVCVPDKREERKRVKPAETVKKARSRIGEKGYNILYNNCEHFARECVLGERGCQQADDVRAFFRNIPVVDVYTAEIPEEIRIENILPRERKKEIEACRNERVRREKYCAWKLLEYAMRRTFGLSMKEAKPEKLPCGKWVSAELYFSIAHSKGGVAVAVSRGNVGVDLEQAVTLREALPQKILTEAELQQYAQIAEEEKIPYLTEKWTQKESIFKTPEEDRFCPEKIETSAYKTATKQIAIGDGEFTLTVATETPERIRYYHNVNCFGKD